MRVLCVPLRYIMNEFGCNDLPLFKMSTRPTPHMAVTAAELGWEGVEEETKQKKPSENRGQMPLFWGNCVKS